MSKAANRMRAIAYHEAGHALGMWRGRLPFRRITIEPGPDYLGMILSGSLRLREEHVYDPSPRVRDRLERKIVAILCGPEAERLVRGRYNHAGAGRVSFGKFNRLSSSGDLDQAVALAEQIIGDTGREFTLYFGWLRERARNIVSNPTWRLALDALAEALLERRTLRGDEAIPIMISAVSKRRPVTLAPRV